MRNIIFFVLSAIIAGLIVYFGINPLSLTKPYLVQGQFLNDKIILSEKDILQFKPDQSVALTAAGQGAGSSIGLRMVSFSPFVENSKNGAQLQLDPKTTSMTAGKKVRVAIVAPPINYKASDEFAVGLGGQNQINWAKAKPKPDTEAASVEIDAPQNGIQKIYLNPDTKGSGRGIDIIALVIKIL